MSTLFARIDPMKFVPFKFECALPMSILSDDISQGSRLLIHGLANVGSVCKSAYARLVSKQILD